MCVTAAPTILFFHCMDDCLSHWQKNNETKHFLGNQKCKVWVIRLLSQNFKLCIFKLQLTNSNFWGTSVNNLTFWMKWKLWDFSNLKFYEWQFFLVAETLTWTLLRRVVNTAIKNTVEISEIHYSMFSLCSAYLFFTSINCFFWSYCIFYINKCFL